MLQAFAVTVDILRLIALSEGSGFSRRSVPRVGSSMACMEVGLIGGDMFYLAHICKVPSGTVTNCEIIRPI